MKLGLLILGVLLIIGGIAIPTIPILNIIICGTICLVLVVLGFILFIAGVVL
jgi:hypothetical protein